MAVWERASAREAPSLTRSRTCEIALLSRVPSTCSVRAPRASSRGMPAPISVASWRVAMARSVPPTGRSMSREKRREKVSSRRTAAPAVGVSSVRKTPSRRSFARALRSLSASTKPRRAFPESLTPL